MTVESMQDLVGQLNEDMTDEEQLEFYARLKQPKRRARVVNSAYSRPRPNPERAWKKTREELGRETEAQCEGDRELAT